MHAITASAVRGPEGHAAMGVSQLASHGEQAYHSYVSTHSDVMQKRMLLPSYGNRISHDVDSLWECFQKVVRVAHLSETAFDEQVAKCHAAEQDVAKMERRVERWCMEVDSLRVQEQAAAATRQALEEEVRLLKTRLRIEEHENEISKWVEHRAASPPSTALEVELVHERKITGRLRRELAVEQATVSELQQSLEAQRQQEGRVRSDIEAQLRRLKRELCAVQPHQHQVSTSLEAQAASRLEGADDSDEEWRPVRWCSSPSYETSPGSPSHKTLNVATNAESIKKSKKKQLSRDQKATDSYLALVDAGLFANAEREDNDVPVAELWAEDILSRADRHLGNGQLTVTEVESFLRGTKYQGFAEWLTDSGSSVWGGTWRQFDVNSTGTIGHPALHAAVKEYLSQKASMQHPPGVGGTRANVAFGLAVDAAKSGERMPKSRLAKTSARAQLLLS